MSLLEAGNQALVHLLQAVLLQVHPPPEVLRDANVMSQATPGIPLLRQMLLELAQNYVEFFGSQSASRPSDRQIVSFHGKRENQRISQLPHPSCYTMHLKEKDLTIGKSCTTPHNYYVRIMPEVADSSSRIRA
jgi:hypothetical protein